MSEMVDKAVEAARAELIRQADLEGGFYYAPERDQADGDIDLRGLVTAVLLSTREPTNDTENAGTRVLALDWEITADGRVAGDVWRAMVDEALR